METKVYCFSLILAASRKKAVCFSLKQDADAIYEAIQELFEELGGVTLELLIDNPIALVIKNDPKNEMENEYNPYALLLAKHLGTELNACPYYWPRKKGKIERPFNYIEEQFIKGNEFSSMEDLNARGKKFINDWNKEVHTTTKRIPDEFYEMEEKQHLLPLPSKRFRVEELKPRKVSPDCLVSWSGSKYSVPAKYADRNVKVRMVYGFRIEIYDTNENLILKVEQSPEKHEIVRNEEHYREIASDTSTSLPQIRRDFTAAFSNGSRYLEAASKQLQQPVRHARRILAMKNFCDTAYLDQLLAMAIDQGKLDYFAFRELFKEQFASLTSGGTASAVPASSSAEQQSQKADNSGTDEPEGLVRSIAYYAEIGKEEAKA